jgi:hypothetical protein
MLVVLAIFIGLGLLGGLVGGGQTSDQWINRGGRDNW